MAQTLLRGEGYRARRRYLWRNADLVHQKSSSTFAIQSVESLSLLNPMLADAPNLLWSREDGWNSDFYASSQLSTLEDREFRD